MATKITFGLNTPRGPAIPAGGPRVKPAKGNEGALRGAPRGNKKGFTGTVAGIGHRGRARIPTVAANNPHGPISHPFNSTQLPNRKRFAAAPAPKPSRLSSLFKRIRGK